ncbi:hypothetical protein KFL01_06040 [Kocuria flava]|uniref:Uncharacterized protein n=1 Tax=Kocuria flava TaxID=446860 RepID=A0ABQ0X1G1_9MICC|nr:hypothetical protein KFL01_06040 [Kocuria flava]
MRPPAHPSPLPEGPPMTHRRTLTALLLAAALVGGGAAPATAAPARWDSYHGTWCSFLLLRWC